MSEYQKAERIPDVSLTPLYAGHGGAGPERALFLKAYLEDHPWSCPRGTLPGTTHTLSNLCCMGSRLLCVSNAQTVYPPGL
jgi:hypothetical protein